MTEFNVKGLKISTKRMNKEDFISLTDIARHKNPEFPADVVKNWLRRRDSIDFLGTWERINNPNFKLVEFDQFMHSSGRNAFVLSPHKWIAQTQAIGITSKSGKNGGTFAHKDIAFEFASWISVEFRLYLIKEFQRLKEKENANQNLEWNVKRQLVKISYKIHTDAIKENLIPHILTEKEILQTYASEADILNMALFGIIAKEWRKDNPKKNGNIRDYVNVAQLVCLSNLESLNAELIKEHVPQTIRLQKLNSAAISQMKSLTNSSSIKSLSKKS